MAEAVIGALRVNLGIDTANFSKGIAAAQSGLANIGKAAKLAGVALAAGMATAAAGMAVAVKRTIDQADALAKMSQRVGFSVEQLSKWKFAADLAGTSLEEMSVSLRRMASNMDDALRGTGDAKLAFERLGISIKDSSGNLKSAEQIMLEVADRFAAMQDGATKSALAMDIFGRSGVSMIPPLNEGAAGLKAMFEQAERLGIVIDTKTAEAAERFNDDLTRLGAVWDGLTIKLTAQLVPGLADLSNKLVVLAENSNAAEGAGKALGDLIGSLPTVYVQFTTQVNLASMALANLIEVGQKINQFDFSGAIEAATQNRQAAIDYANSQERVIQNMEYMATVLAAESQILRDNTAAKTENSAASAVDVEKAKEHIDALIKQRMALDEQGQSMAESVRGPMEQYRAKLEEIGRLQEAGAISSEVAAKVQAQAHAAAAADILGAASAVSGALAGIFKDNKAFAIANAVINTAEAVTSALKNPPGPPFSFAYAAAAAAAGAAQIAAIASAQPGSSKKPAASTSAGAVSTAAAAGGGNRGGGGVEGSLNVTLIGRSGFSDEQVNGLIDQINDRQRDGKVLIRVN